MKLTPWMLTVTTFGIIALLAVGFLLKKVWSTAEIVDVPKPPARTLPMAIMDLEPGMIITRAHVGLGPRPTEGELNPDTLLSIDGVLGRMVKEAIPRAKPLSGSMFYAPGDRPDQKVAAGKRAVAIRISETSVTLLQKLKPEQYVDVLLTVEGIEAGGRNGPQATRGTAQNNSSTNNAMTATLFKGVKIVSMSRTTTTVANSQDSVSANVTLELDEEQSRIALLAQQRGVLDLVYNPAGPGTGGIEVKSEQEGRVTVGELLGLKEELERDKPFKAEHYRGSSRGRSYYRDGERLDGRGDDDDGGISNGTNWNEGYNGDGTTKTAPADRGTSVAKQQPNAASTEL